MSQARYSRYENLDQAISSLEIHSVVIGAAAFVSPAVIGVAASQLTQTLAPYSMQTTLTYLTVAFVVLGMIILGATLPWFYRRLQKRLDAAEAYFKNPSAR